MRPLLLEAKGVSKAYSHPRLIDILKGVDLQIKGGESVAILGRSGEGKSTLLQILGTLEDPCKGFISIQGEAVTASSRARMRNEKIGFVFQSFHLLEDYTALENVLMPARIARQSVSQGSPAERRGRTLLEQVELQERIHYPISLLSGGEKQRVALARAMCNDPCLILADEPSGNLDRQTAQLIHQILLGFACHPKKALLLVTHDDKLAQLCTHQYELRQGVLFYR